MTTTITYGDSLALINNSIRDISNELPVQDSDIEKIIFAVNNDLQIRDYLIGLPNSYTLSECSEFVDYLARMAGDENRYAFDTVNAMYQYELENSVACVNLLGMSESINPDYSLTKLIRRVVQASWPSDSFAIMRDEIAESVFNHINENADRVIEGNN